MTLCSAIVPCALIECKISSTVLSSVIKLMCAFFTSVASYVVTNVSLKLKFELNDALLVLDLNDSIERSSSTAIKWVLVVPIEM